MSLTSQDFWPKPESDSFIYALIDPRTDEIKYIGQTIHGTIYPSYLEASKQIGCTPTDIRRCILNPNKRIKGLSFTKVESNG